MVPTTKAMLLDAVVLGAGPSGLGASMALSGYRPYYIPACTVADPGLGQRLMAHVQTTPSGRLVAAVLPALAAGLRGRSHYPVALLLDALQHPGADSVRPPMSSCLELRRDGPELSHVMLDPLKLGGRWHAMHQATRTLSPGPWMELPGFSLADFIRSETGVAHDVAVRAAASRQPRRRIAQYYEAFARRFGLDRHHRREAAASIQYDSGLGSEESGVWVIEFEGGSPPLRARNLILAIGTAGTPKVLGLEGEGLDFVSHRCREPATVRSGGESTVLVVGAGLSAGDCIVHHLRQGRKV